MSHNHHTDGPNALRTAALSEEQISSKTSYAVVKHPKKFSKIAKTSNDLENLKKLQKILEIPKKIVTIFLTLGKLQIFTPKNDRKSQKSLSKTL